MDKELGLELVLAKDCENIRNIMIEIYEDEKTKWFKNGNSPYIPGYNSVAMQLYHTWDNKYYKIIYNNEIVGVTLISCTGREHARIDRLYILPQYQGIGIGSEILKLIEKLFPNVNHWSLDTIQQSSRNHHFYEKNGYVLIDEDEEDRYYHKVINKDLELQKYYWGNLDLSKYNFRRCNMKSVDFYDLDMSYSRFCNINLSENIYLNSCLINNRLTNVNMRNSIFADSKMDKVEICHVSLSGAYLHDINLDIDDADCNLVIERCKLNNSTIVESNLQNLCIENCNVEGMTINGIKVVDMLKCYNKNYN
ncbi:MAG: GNAT family N-acetyltransferase [Cellulosilyticaceae bacterium]